jgi:hypothetical protein
VGSQFTFIPEVLGWEIDRVGGEDARSVRVGIDATMAMDKRDDLIRPVIPGAGDVRLEDYLQ